MSSSKKIRTEVWKVDKWDGLKGKVYVIVEKNSKKVITFGKYSSGDTNKTILRENKKHIDIKLKNFDLAQKIRSSEKIPNLEKPKRIKTLQTFKDSSSKITWRVKQVKPSNLKKGSVFQFIGEIEKDEGETGYFRTKSYVYVNERSLAIAINELSSKVAHYGIEIKDMKIKLIKWYESRYHMNRYG